MATIAAASLLLIAATLPGAAQQPAAERPSPPADELWTVPEIGALPDDRQGREVRHGRDLITATYAYIGPQVREPAQRFAGNSLACSNCHLRAGTKMYGLPIFGLFGEYPRYSARSGATSTIEDRINQCMTRSMNGAPLPVASPEMRAIVAYVKFLSSGVAPGEIVRGRGAGAMPELERPADPGRGAQIYAKNCSNCHGAEGAGYLRQWPARNAGYLFPPLWGPGSFNDGAGINRLINAANFVHSNMPIGTDYLSPRLSVEDGWDVAAYLVSQPRPHKASLDKDFPDPLAKPVDAPYGPYADSFSEAQHKYGPFAPIREMVARLRAQKAEERAPAAAAPARQ